MRAVLVEGRLLYHAGYALSANLDLEPGTRGRAFRRNVCCADGNVQRRAHRPAPHLPTRRTIHENRIPVPGKRALTGGKTDELSLDAILFLANEGVAPHEVAFLQLDEPLKICLERRDGVVDIVPVKRHAHLETKTVTTAQPRRHHVAFLENRVPYLRRVFVREVKLESILARVTRARDENAIHTGNSAESKVIVLDRRQVSIGEALENRGGFRSLQREQSRLVAHVLERRIEAAERFRDVREILRGIRRVHYHHDVIVGAINETIVFDRAAIGAGRGIVS